MSTSVALGKRRGHPLLNTRMYTQIFGWQGLLPKRNCRERSTIRFQRHLTTLQGLKGITADQEINSQPATKPENSCSPVQLAQKMFIRLRLFYLTQSPSCLHFKKSIVLLRLFYLFLFILFKLISKALQFPLGC